MRKKRLTKRLLLHFSVTLILFALIMGSVFSWLFTHYNQHVHEEETMQRALTLAAAIPVMKDSHQFLAAAEDEPAVEESSGRMRHGHHGRMVHSSERGNGTAQREMDWCRQQYSVQDTGGREANQQAGEFLQQLDSLAQGKVWLVAEKSRTILAYGENTGEERGQLPAPVNEMLQQVLAGQTAVSHDFGALLDTPSVTVGAPIKDKDDRVIGAVLIHRPLEDLQNTINGGLRLLAISVLLAMVLAGVLAVLLVRRFIRPLYRMQHVSRAYAQGNYGERTGIRQQDEIGMLAADIDVLGGKLAQAEQERAELSRQRQEFLAAVSHELRTPLTVLRGTLELLFSGLVTQKAERQKYLQQVMSNLSALERLVGDLLELTRLRNTGFSVGKEPLNLCDAFEDAVEQMRPAAAKKNLQLRVDFVEPLPIQGDYGRLRQLMLILLDNAVKFSHDGGEILIQGRRQGENWQVMVEDHGCGIEPAELPHIFDRFKTNRNRNEQGTGLGLTIAREIASRHEMEITCESELSKGTRFIIKGDFSLVNPE
ncbi:HAMP domain-containing sensor histidine kinase [Selenomonas sp.]|uniref:sensor histidine kinase n=1 Tax=Selenomonas sp. TaxID=2053611 RepID=UPI0025DA340E|nr:HAMP domain-containing sensor histidine kinase [Selenomonas sp.]